MVRRPLGLTGHLVTPLGFGAFKIGRNQGMKYPVAYDLPSDADVDRLLNGVLDLGINLIDTAPAYGTSEEHIGSALAHRRREYILCTKVGESFGPAGSTFDFTEAGIKTSIARSLRHLRTDVIDILLIHSDGSDLPILDASDAVPTVLHLRDRGLVRAVGFSGKTPAGARAACAWADVIMVEYHAQDSSHAEVIAHASRRGVGVLVKKALASGRLPAADGLRFVFQTNHVCCAVVGGLNLAHMRDNLATAVEAVTERRA